MNIAAVASKGNNIIASPRAQQQQQQFGNVFGQVLSNSQVQKPMQLGENVVETDPMNDLLDVLGMESIEQLENLLGMGELTVNPKELELLINKLLGKEQDTASDLLETDIWDVLAGIHAQANQLTDAIVASLNGQGPATQMEAKQAVQLLKIAQLIGTKSDLTLKQESSLFDLKQLLDSVKEVVSKTTTTETKSLVTVQGFKSVIQHIVQSGEAVQQGHAPLITQTKVEIVTLPTEKPAQSEELMKQLQKVMDRVQFGQAGGANRLVVKLYPEQLGTIRIELIQKDGLLTARMLASTALGKDLLDSNSNQLRQGLVNQNIQVEKIEISQALQDASRQDRNQSFSDSFKQQQEQQQQENSDDDQPEKQTSFRDFLMEMEV